MNLKYNGFDIEIIAEDETLALRIMDASGKELSNNTYSQSMSGESDEIIEPDINSDELIDEEPTDEVEEPTDEVEEPTDEVEEPTDESILSFEDFKKSLLEQKK